MCQVTVLRISLLVFIGTMLYVILLNMNGFANNIRLKKRKLDSAQNQSIRSSKFFFSYVLLLICFISVGFIIISFSIRGVQ